VAVAPVEEASGADFTSDESGITIDASANPTDIHSLSERSPSHVTEVSVDQSSADPPESRVTEISVEPSSVDLPEITQPQIQENMRGGLFMLSDGFFQLMVLQPVVARPSLTEAEVESIGTTWTHGCSEEVPSFPAAMRTVDTPVCEGDTQRAAHESCGICMQSFDEGDKMLALPCTTHGCGSVWHLQCIHKWLNQGSAASCPLCRAQIDVGGVDSSSMSPSFSTMTVRGHSNSSSGNRLSQDLFGVLFQALLSQQLSAASHGGSIPMPMTTLATQASVVEADDEVGMPREPTVALA